MEDGISVLADFDSALFEHVEPPLVSIYLPTHGQTETDSDRIQLKDLVEEVREKLTQEYEHREHTGIDDALDYFIEHVDDLAGTAPQGGLAAFISNDGTYLYNLGYPVEARARVGERFYVKPLLNTFQYGAHYFLLGLSADRFAFIHGDFGSLDRVELPADVHDEFSELFQEVYDGHEGALDYDSLENHLPPYHGWKSRNDVKEEEAEKFFYYVNKAVTEHLVKGTDLPVILVSLPEHQTLFRKISTIPNLLDEGIEKDVNGIEAPELLADAVAVIEKVREQHTDAIVEEFGNAQAAGTGSDEPEAIGFALVERKVRVLLVEEDAEVPGVFNEETGAVSLCAAGDEAAEDLVDVFAQATLEQGGEVCLIDARLMPTGTGMTAIYRY